MAGTNRVTEVSFGYVMQSSTDGKGTLEPVYLFEGDDQIGNANKAFEPVTIDAKKKVNRTFNSTDGKKRAQ